MYAFFSLFLFVFCFVFKERLLPLFIPALGILLKISALRMLPLSRKGTLPGVLLSIASDHLWNIVRFRLLHNHPKIKYLTVFHLETVL